MEHCSVYGGALETGSCRCSLQVGTVRLLGSHGDIDVSVGESGRVSVLIPAGRYEVEAGLRTSADWPMGSCGQVDGPDARHDSQGHLSYMSELDAWATAAGIVLALGVLLAVTVGLIRSETAGDLKVLTAAGASRRIRRTLTSVTAGAIGHRNCRRLPRRDHPLPQPAR
jgi:hypothetical protein